MDGKENTQDLAKEQKAALKAKRKAEFVSDCKVTDVSKFNRSFI